MPVLNSRPFIVTKPHPESPDSPVTVSDPTLREFVQGTFEFEFVSEDEAPEDPH
jgi:hypothetical protein